jgi:hypothetical protein
MAAEEEGWQGNESAEKWYVGGDGNDLGSDDDETGGS